MQKVEKGKEQKEKLKRNIASLSFKERFSFISFLSESQ